MPFLISFVGRSGSGKTTLISKLLEQLSTEDFKIGTIKNTHHDVSFDKPGKDSWQHRKAGAELTLAVSPSEFALFGKTPNNPSLHFFVENYFSDCDLIIAEGFKKEFCDLRIEVHRSDVKQKSLLTSNGMPAQALVTDYPVKPVGFHHFHINDVGALSKWILDNAGLNT